MANFMTSLWEAIFVPGPTPPLLLATNVTFGALQALLFALLIATYSVHFVVLSFLCAGLWGAINWFAAELIQAQEEEKKTIADKEQKTAASGTGELGNSESSDEDQVREGTPQVRQRDVAGKLRPQDSEGAGTGLNLSAPGADTRQRTTASSSVSGEMSTDSEWEKVEEE